MGTAGQDAAAERKEKGSNFNQRTLKSSHHKNNGSLNHSNEVKWNQPHCSSIVTEQWANPLDPPPTATEMQKTPKATSQKTD